MVANIFGCKFAHCAATLGLVRIIYPTEHIKQTQCTAYTDSNMCTHFGEQINLCHYDHQKYIISTQIGVYWAVPCKPPTLHVRISPHTQYCKVKHTIIVDNGTCCNCITVLWTFPIDFSTTTMPEHHSLGWFTFSITHSCNILWNSVSTFGKRGWLNILTLS